MSFCRECGNELSEGQKFCNECGTSILRQGAKEVVADNNMKKALSAFGISYNVYIVALIMLVLAPIIQFCGIFSLEANLLFTEIEENFSWYSISALVSEYELDLKEYGVFMDIVPIVLGIASALAVFFACKCESVNKSATDAVSFLTLSSILNIGVLIGNVALMLFSGYVLDYALGSYKELASIKFSTIGILYIACSVVGIALSQYILHKE